MQLQSYNCELRRLATEETLNHIFLESYFARSCWNILNLNFPAHASFHEVTLRFRDVLNSELFLNAAIIMCWTIGGVRRDSIFNGIGPNIQVCRNNFKKELALTPLKAKESSQRELFYMDSKLVVIHSLENVFLVS